MELNNIDLLQTNNKIQTISKHQFSNSQHSILKSDKNRNYSLHVYCCGFQTTIFFNPLFPLYPLSPLLLIKVHLEDIVINGFRHPVAHVFLLLYSFADKT